MMSQRDLMGFADFLLRRRGQDVDGNETFTDEFKKMIYNQNPDICRSERLTDNEAGPTYVGMWATGYRNCNEKDKSEWLSKDHPKTLVIAGYGGMQCAFDEMTGLTYCRTASDARSHGPAWDPLMRRARACFSRDVTVNGKNLKRWTPSLTEGKPNYGVIDFDNQAKQTAGPGGSLGALGKLEPSQLTNILKVLDKNPITNCHALDMCNCVKVTLAQLGNSKEAIEACAQKVAPRQFVGALDSINAFLKTSPTKKALLGSDESLAMNVKLVNDRLVSQLVFRMKVGGQTQEFPLGQAIAHANGIGEQCEMNDFAQTITEGFQAALENARRTKREESKRDPAKGANESAN